MGYDFVAWFTEEIPVNAGPDKFDGLNGLILSVEMENSEIIAYSVDNLQKKPKIEKPVFEGETYTFTEALNGVDKSSNYVKKPSEILLSNQDQKQQIKTYTTITSY